MAEWTPYSRASYEQAATTPRWFGWPPTMTGLPSSSGSNSRSTEQKKVSMSMWTIALCRASFIVNPACRFIAASQCRRDAGATSIDPQHSPHLALYLDRLVRTQDDRLHRGVGRLEPDARTGGPGLLVELLEGHPRAVD